MKLFKRTAKDADPVTPSTELAASIEPKKTKRDLNDLLPGLAAAFVGIALAGALLWFGPLSNANQVHLQQLSQAWGGSQATVMQKALQQLSADTQAAARNPQLLLALQSQDTAQIRAAERNLTYWHNVVDAHLNARGQAIQDMSRSAPMNFAALDMLRRVENGQTPPAEAYKVGQRWLVYSAAPLRLKDGDPLHGTLLLVVDLERLLANLPVMPPEIGQIQLIQQFNNTAAQVLMQRGQAAGPAQSFSTGNPNWSISFIPGASLSESVISPLLLGIAGLLALLGALVGLHLLTTQQQRKLQADALQLGQMLKELNAGKSIKAFSLSLPALDSLAQNLARTPRRAHEPAAAMPASTTTNTSSPTRSAPPAPSAAQTMVDPLFQDTDILDIDILDEDQDLLGLDEAPPAPPSINAPKLPADIFRAYDIRGVVGRTLHAETAYWIGRAIGSQTIAQGEPNIAVGRDGRLSGPALTQQLIQGLLDSGCHVSDVGMVPTPVVYFAGHVLTGKSAVMLTGSHNPADYNGFKIVIAGDTLANEQIQALHTRLKTNDLTSGNGSITKVDILQRYSDEITGDVKLARRLKVVVDCGNGAAGVIAPQLLEALNCEVVPLFCDVDGNFPNHHPDPGKPENLVDLIAKVKETGADVGLAFDGDGDRVGVVTNTGENVFADRLLMLFARDVVARNPNAEIIFDVKCTRRLTPLIKEYGGRPLMWKTGHSLIKKKMKETGALLAGEMSGHVFFKERWFGFDDGIYSAARLLEILSKEKSTAQELFQTFPNDISTPEINIHVTEESKFSIIDALHDAQWGEGANLTSIDGVRVDYAKGWGLVRASNTTPVLVLRFEADTEAELQRIKDVFHVQLKRVAPDLQLPF